MKPYQLIPLLDSVQNAKKENRDKVALIVLQHDYLFPALVQKVFDTKDKRSIKAAWILEWITTHYSLEKLLPYLDPFCESLTSLGFDGCIRPCSKICEQLARSYYHKGNQLVKSHLTATHLQHMIEAGFQWLITPQKIAVRAYTMQMLYYHGKSTDWIHAELEHLIRTKIIHESKGCRARGIKVLELIEKHRERHS